MRNRTCQFVMLALIILLPGCGVDRQTAFERQIQIERQARSEAVKRETDATKQKERWQCAAYTSAVLAVILLVAGTAIGSKVRSHNENSTDQN